MRPASLDEKRALDPRTERNETKRRRVRGLSEEGLVLCFRHRLCAHVICNNQFRVLYPVFLTGFHGKN